MDRAVLDKRMRSITKSERWHLEHPGEPSPIYETTRKVNAGGIEVYYFDWRNTVKRNFIGMIKETRFATVPPHVNSNMELDFVYDGTCELEIDGKRVILQRGDAILIDTEAVRSSPVPKAENDIVIALTFERDFFDSVFLSRLPGGGILTTFLFEAIANRRRSMHYITIEAEHTGNLFELLMLLTNEYMFPNIYTPNMLEHYATLVFIELIRGLYYQSQITGRASRIDDGTARVLDYIEHHYKECTLTSTAEEFGYSPNYLSNMLKAKTGETFSQIKLGQQLSEAAYLLLNTERSIESIAKKVGISNQTFFYKKFSTAYGMTPKKYRETMRV